MSKVFLGVGHGGNDPGAVGYLREEDVNLNMALACRDYLVANGVEVLMSRMRDENDTLNEEIRECNAYNPDLAVDIHNNAGGGDGFEVYYSVSGEGKTLAQNLEAEVKALGQNSRGCKTKRGNNGDYYGFIRSTKCKAVIVEGVFVDNANDVKIADTLEEQKAFGVAYAKGILKELGITAQNKPTQATQQTVTTAHKLGETVKINGVYTSSTSDKKLKPAITTGTITAILTGARNPYLLNNGNIGWVNDSCIVLTANQQPVEKPVDNAIKVGDKVRVKRGAKSYKGVALASFIYKNVYDVMELNGNRAVIGKNGAVTTDIHLNNLYK